MSENRKCDVCGRAIYKREYVMICFPEIEAADRKHYRTIWFTGKQKTINVCATCGARISQAITEKITMLGNSKE